MKAITVLNFNKMTWKQLDKEHLLVIFYGSFDEDYARIENELNRLQMCAVKRTYDKRNNITLTTYKMVNK